MALLNDGCLIERKGLGALIALFASVGFCSKYKEISPLGRSWLVQTRASEYTGVNVQAKTMSQDWVGSGEKVVVGGKPPRTMQECSLKSLTDTHIQKTEFHHTRRTSKTTQTWSDFQRVREYSYKHRAV